MVEIRKAAAEDGTLLVGLVREFASSFPTDEGAFRNLLPEILGNPDADLLVAEENDELLGYILAFHHPTFFANGPVTWIEELFVEEEVRFRGTGRQLVRTLEDRARARNSKLVALATRRAEAFYAAIGYDGSAIYFRKLL